MCNQGLPNLIKDINDDITTSREGDKKVTFYDNEKCENDPCGSGIPNSLDFRTLNSIAVRNKNRLILAHLNINSLRHKFDALKLNVRDRVDILVITETKIDVSFPDAQFTMEGYKPPIRMDRTAQGGGIIIYIREEIHSRLLGRIDSGNDDEGILLEINIRNNKWLLFGGYNPKRENISHYFRNVESLMNKHINKYDNIIILGDFNCDILNNAECNKITDFCMTYSLKNLVNQPTCFKNPKKPSCLDLIITNRKERFHDTTRIETGLSDYHMMTVTCLKRYIKKLPPKIVYYRNYKNFNASVFRSNLINILSSLNEANLTYDIIKSNTMSLLNENAPIKKAHIRANNAPYMNKTLRKSIMTRSRLKNRYTKFPNVENEKAYKKHRNLCVYLLRKSKREYYRKIDIKKLNDNRKFWENIRPFFSEKQKKINTIVLVENNNDIISDVKNIAETFNT